jgi:hypothetical protein
MEKPQREQARSIFYFDQQRSSATHGHGGSTDFRLYYRVGLIPQSSDGSYPGSILISQREVKEQIFEGADAEVGQAGRHLVSHSAQAGDRLLKNALAQARPDTKRSRGRLIS